MRIDMNQAPILILLIEDNTPDAELIRIILSEASYESFEISRVERLSEALKSLRKNTFDIVLVDLGLPDSQGLDSFRTIYAAVPETPIVVLTGLSDETVGLQAVRAGAQDYLIKDQLDTNLLTRSIRYAIERGKLQDELASTRRREQDARTSTALEKISQASNTSVTAKTFGVLPIKDGTPEYFGVLVQRYQKLMDIRFEQRIFQIEYDVSEALREMADELGFIKAGPRDAIEIYIAALKEIGKDVPLVKREAYAEEGRIMLLELMGNLVLFYRKSHTSYRFGKEFDK
jgi:DNA-binding response OmpR family regulator